MDKKNVIIMGAAGRDFHNFNMQFRSNPHYSVVAFTAAQIEGIQNRIYPAELAGKQYPQGIPIYPEERLVDLIPERKVDEVVLAYSDLSHAQVMEKASIVLSRGADFRMMGFKSTMLRSRVPVVSVCATRTGAGKSMVTDKVVEILRALGKKVVVVRHPMPYGDLKMQAAQRFESIQDCIKHQCTLEEREEYEHKMEQGVVVYAGIDYEKILRRAEEEADILVWDGGNNDFPFFIPSLHIVVADPLRPGHEISYHPGETNARAADVVIINKTGSAKKEDIDTVAKNIRRINKKALILKADVNIAIDGKAELKGKRVLAIDDGPTLTHGGMPYGAAWIAAKRAGARIVDPRPYAVGSIRSVFKRYPHIGAVLPAVGYTPAQTRDLQTTINRTEADYILVGTPIDLSRFMKFNKPVVRVRYSLKGPKGKKLEDLLGKLVMSLPHKSLNLENAKKYG